VKQLFKFIKIQYPRSAFVEFFERILVGGTPINSFVHSKACALLSILVYLNLLADDFMAPIATIEIYIYTDSKSNVKRITQIDIRSERNSQMKHSAQAGICIRQSTEN
jgi:hypothetical protein